MLNKFASLVLVIALVSTLGGSSAFANSPMKPDDVVYLVSSFCCWSIVDFVRTARINTPPRTFSTRLLTGPKDAR